MNENELNKRIRDLENLCEFAGVPKLLIEHPNLLFGKPSKESIEWAKQKVEEYLKRG